MTAPAGWYPDPTDPGSQRWWDGDAWTELVVGATGQPGGQGAALDAQESAQTTVLTDEPVDSTETAPAVGAAASSTAAADEGPNVGTPPAEAPASSDAAASSEESPTAVGGRAARRRAAEAAAGSEPPSRGSDVMDHTLPAARPSSTPRRRSLTRRQRRLLIGGLVLVVALLIALIVTRAVNASRIQAPAATPAEQAWVDLGQKTGEIARKGSQLPDPTEACRGAFTVLPREGQDTPLLDVPQDRAENLFVSGCVEAITSTESSPSASPSAAG